MTPDALLASAHPMAHAQWTGTQLSGGGMFWLGIVNVAMLVVFLIVGTQRRDRPTAASERAATSEYGGVGTGTGLDGEGARTPAGPEPVALLASDAERDQAASRVSDAMAAGRLSVEEGVARIDAVYASRDRAQLATVIADLPPEPAPAPASSARRRSRCYRDLRDFAALALGAAVVLQLLAGIWEMWPVVVAAMAPFAFRRGRTEAAHAHDALAPTTSPPPG